MKEKLEKLVNVKSIVTIIMSVVFCVLALTNRISGSEFLSVFTTVIAFYYGTQYEKKNPSNKEVLKEEQL